MSLSYASLFIKALAEERLLPPLKLFKHPDWHALWQLREHLILRARDAAMKRGHSYRGFQVGAAAFLSSTKPTLLRELGRPKQVIYTGSNWKAGKDERNTCAEQEIVAQIRQQQHLFPARKILALVIAGERQDEPDAESGVLTATLHPCRHCRRLLQQVQEIKPDTVIITITSDDTLEVQRFDELIRLHRPTPTDTS